MCGAIWDQGQRQFKRGKGLITEEYFKRRRFDGRMNRAVVTVLDNMQVCVPLSGFRKIDTESMHKGLVDYLSLSIRFKMKGSRKEKFAA